MDIKVEHEGENVTIRDICLQPLSPGNEACAIFSPLQYWQNKKENLDKCLTDMGDDCNDPQAWGSRAQDWHDQIIACTS